MDSFGTGFLVQSLLALWLYQSFQISVTTAAAILFWSGVCSAISYLVAVPIAKRIGLINTMVFTHLPSNLFLILIPFAPDLATAIGLLLARSALSQMDVPTRASYVMAVVAPEERPAAASITAVPKTFAWGAGSIISGYLLTLTDDWVGIAIQIPAHGFRAATWQGAYLGKCACGLFIAPELGIARDQDEGTVRMRLDAASCQRGLDRLLVTSQMIKRPGLVG
jgi:predicted MFS family arabinose efflux permease